MFAEINSNAESISFSYNDLANLPEVGFSKRTVRKNQIVYIALEKTGAYVEIFLAHDQIFQINHEIVSSPACSSNAELYDALTAMIA